MQRPARRRAYFAMMGTALVLILLAWNLVRLWSTTAAVMMSVIAAVIPPAAVIVANLGAMEEQRPTGETQLDEERDRERGRR